MPITAECIEHLQGAAEAGEKEITYFWRYQEQSQETGNLQMSLGTSQIQHNKIKFNILGMGSRTRGYLGAVE